MPVDQSGLYGGYAKASRPRLPKRVIESGLGLYDLKIEQAKGQTDSQLRRMAAKAVIARRRKQQAAATPAPAAAAPATAAPAAAPIDYAGKVSPFGTRYPAYVHTAAQVAAWTQRAIRNGAKLP